MWGVGIETAQASNFFELVGTLKLQINCEISHELIKTENLMFRITMTSKFIFYFLKKIRKETKAKVKRSK